MSWQASFEKVDFCDRRKMEVDYNSLSMSDLKNLTIFRGLWGCSRLRKSKLINVLKFHDAVTQTSTEIVAQKQFDPEEGRQNGISLPCTKDYGRRCKETISFSIIK